MVTFRAYVIPGNQTTDGKNRVLRSPLGVALATGYIDSFSEPFRVSEPFMVEATRHNRLNWLRRGCRFRTEEEFLKRIELAIHPEPYDDLTSCTGQEDSTTYASISDNLRKLRSEGIRSERVIISPYRPSSNSEDLPRRTSFLRSDNGSLMYF